MHLLALVAEKLGSVHNWPSSVITDMCYEEPNVNVSRMVAAFVYGNGVSVRDAAKLYKASQTAWTNVPETHMYGWYVQHVMGVSSTVFYFDMKTCVMWLGSDEGVEPDVTVRKFGPATSERAFRINQRIADLRRDWSGRNT